MRQIVQVLWKVLLVAAGTVLVGSLTGVLLPSEGLGAGADPAVMLGLVFLVHLATAAVMVYPVSRSSLPRGRLLLATFLAIFGLNVVLIEMEAAVFLDMTTTQIVAGAAHSTVAALVLSALMVVVFARGERPARASAAEGTPLTAGRWVARVALCAVSYMVLYFVAGLIIYPFVKSFYDTQTLSVEPQMIAPLQILRGALYVAFVLPLLRSLVAPRRRVQLAMAFAFPVLAGVVALLLPNPFMPAMIRPYHMGEIFWSNFVYGWLVASLFWNPRAGLAGGMASPRLEVADAA